MKLNYDLIKQILIFIEESEETDGSGPLMFHQNDAEESFPGVSFEVITYHFHILDDDGLIQGFDKFHGGFYFNRLTANGHRVLEAMKNNGLWDKIKNGAIAAGISGLQQIPSTAIQVLLAGAIK